MTGNNGKKKKGQAGGGKEKEKEAPVNISANKPPIKAAWGKAGGGDAGDDAADNTGPSRRAAWPDISGEKPTAWTRDRPLTDHFISRIDDNEDLRNALYSGGQLQRLDSGDGSKALDDHFFNIADTIFTGNDKHAELAGAVEHAKETGDKKDIIDLMKARWHQLVDMTKSADDDIADDAKDITDEEEIEKLKDEDVKKKLQDTKAKHPWYFKLRNLVRRETKDAPEFETVTPATKEIEGTTGVEERTGQHDLIDSNNLEDPVTFPMPTFVAEPAPINNPMEESPGIKFAGASPSNRSVANGDDAGDEGAWASAGSKAPRKSNKERRNEVDNVSKHKPLPVTPISPVVFTARATDSSMPLELSNLQVTTQIQQPTAKRGHENHRLAETQEQTRRDRLSRPSSPVPDRPSTPSFNHPARSRSPSPAFNQPTSRSVKQPTSAAHSRALSPAISPPASPAFPRPPSAARIRTRSRASSEKSGEKDMDAMHTPVFAAVVPDKGKQRGMVMAPDFPNQRDSRIMPDVLEALSPSRSNATPTATRARDTAELVVGDTEERMGRFSRPRSPAFGSQASRARSTGSARRVGEVAASPVPVISDQPVAVSTRKVKSPIPITPDDLASRLEQVARSRPDSPVPENPKTVQEWVQEVASTKQADPLVTMPPTDFETLGPTPAEEPMPREQLPTYSLGNGVGPAGPSGGGNHSLGYTGNSMLEEKNRDEKHPFPTPWTSDALKTPHFGFGYDLPSETAAPPHVENEKVDLGKTSSLGRPGVGKLPERAPSPVRMPIPEPAAPVLRVEIPPVRPIEVIVPPTKGKETSRSIGNGVPTSQHTKVPSQSGAFSAMGAVAAAAAAAAAPRVAGSLASGTKQPGAPRLRNVSDESQVTVRASEKKPEPEKQPIVHQPKDLFRSSTKSSVPMPRPQSYQAPVPNPAPEIPNVPFLPPGAGVRRDLPSFSSPAIPSRLRTVDPPLSIPGRAPFPKTDAQPRPSNPPEFPNHYARITPTPMTAAAAAVPPPIISNIDTRPRVSSSSKKREPPTIQPLASGSGRPRAQSESRSMAPILVGAAALGAGAYVANKLDESNKDGNQRRRASAEQRLPQSGSSATIGALTPQKGTYQPFIPVPGSSYTPPVRTPVTFDFSNQPERRSSGEKKKPIVPSPRSRSDSFGSESTVRQTRPVLVDQYDRDRRDRERERERDREREREREREGRHGSMRRRRWDDDRSVATTRVRYASPTRSDDRSIATTRRRYSSPARSDLECDCSSCRNAWIWKSLEYCGLAVAFTIYLGFMGKVLFQNQGIRLF
ncbi:hypothetical protein FRB93_014045 [Tulasnella sp. JGI-2019a]|nr:hypothetical protein FRB93_014045 [Tulasnella sp. JGI-2019a]